MKHDMAYDYLAKIMISADDVLPGCLHDPLRYFSRPITKEEYENGNIENCKVLTVHREHTYTNKNGKTISVKRHFAEVGECTDIYKTKIREQIKALESKIHKTAKELFKTLVELNIPITIGGLTTYINGEAVTILDESKYIITEIIGIEKKEEGTNRIPDITCKIKSLTEGYEIRVLFEICVTHEVDYKKRLEYEYTDKACVEIHVWDIRIAEDEDFKIELLKAIATRGNWITNPIVKNSIIPIYRKNGVLQVSGIYTESDTDKRYYAFKDTLIMMGLPTDRACLGYGYKAVNYGRCKECEHCIYFKDSDNPDEVLIVCNKEDNKKKEEEN